MLTIILPWLTTGSLVYIWTYIRHGGISVSSFALFIGGYGSYLWYMPVFVLLLIIYSLLRNTRYLLIIPIVYGIVVASFGLVPKLAGNDYNLFYHLTGAWPVAFGLGFTINRFSLKPKLKMIVVRYGK